MSNISTETINRPKIEPRLDVKEPGMYKVIYVNDEVTTMDFVIESLVTIFGYTESDAETATMEIHTDGSAVIAVLPYEIAEQKGIEVTLLAKSNGFPLVVKLEADE